MNEYADKRQIVLYFRKEELAWLAWKKTLRNKFDFFILCGVNYCN